MSSYLSQPYQANQPFKDENFPLLAKVMELRQGKYDLAKSKMQQTLDAFGQIQVLRDIDNNYIGEKLNSVVSEVNDLGNLDLSRARNSDMLQHKIKSAAGDPIILNAIEQTQKYKTYLATGEEAKKNKTYSDINFQHGLKMAGFDKYYNDTTGTVNKMGALTYIPFKDVSDIELDQIKKIKEIRGKREVAFASNDGLTPAQDGKHIVKKSIDGMTDGDIKDYMQSNMSPEVKQQLMINGMARFGWDEEKIKESYGTFQKLQVESLEQAKKNALAIPNESGKVKIIQEKIDYYKKNDKSASDMASIIESESFVNNLASTAGAEWSIGLEKNDVHFEMLKMEREDQKTRAQNKKDGIDAEGNPIVQVSTSTATMDLPETAEGMASVRTVFTKSTQVIRDKVSELLPKLPEKEKEAFYSALDGYNVSRDLKWKDKEGDRRGSVETNIVLAFKKAGLSKYKDVYGDLTEAETSRIGAAKDIVSLNKVGISETFNKNPDKYVTELRDASKLATLAIPIETTASPFGRIGGLGNPFIISNIATKASGGKKLAELGVKINDFAKQAGGFDNMKNYLKDNPDKIREFADLLDKSDKTFKGVQQGAGIIGISNPFKNTSDFNLLEDSKKDVEKEVKKRSADGSLATFTTYNRVILKSESVASELIGALDAEKVLGANVVAIYGQGGENFNAKLPITFSLMGENIVMTQNQEAIGYKDNKDGTKSTTKGAKRAVYVLEPSDTAFALAKRYMDKESDKKRGYNANTSTAKMPYSQVNFPDQLPDTKNDQDDLDNKANTLRALDMRAPNGRSVFGNTDPTVYMTSQSISSMLTDEKNGGVAPYLNEKFGKENVQAFNSNLLNRIKGFKVRPIVKEVYTDAGNTKVWGMEILNDKGEVFLSKSMGLEDLNRDTRYAMEIFPQTFIMHALMQELQNSQDKNVLSTVLDEGIKTRVNGQ